MTASLRAVVVCPGRGSYGREQLGTLARAAASDVASEADALAQARAAFDRWRDEPLAVFDEAERFSPSSHLRADHASALIFSASYGDWGLLRGLVADDVIEPVAVCGNSLGFYTALAVSGALSVGDAARLVQTMASMQVEQGVVGGQVLYPLVDGDSWAPDIEKIEAVEAVRILAAERGVGVWTSIVLGGHVVLAADAAGLKLIDEALPVCVRKKRRYPMHLAGHSAFHTPCMAPMAQRAQEQLKDLAWQMPGIPLIDGRGGIWRPQATQLAALADYTLGHQVTEPFNFSASIWVALREYAPDLVICLGPGESLGGPIGQLLVAERWRGIDSREAFVLRQSEKPFVVSMGRSQQRNWLRLLPSFAGAASQA